MQFLKYHSVLKTSSYYYCENQTYNKYKGLSSYDSCVLTASKIQDKKINFEKMTDKEIVNYLKNSPKNYINIDSITIDASKILGENNGKINAAGDTISDNFTSEDMETGTPGVYWRVYIEYEAKPLSNGTGYYFSKINKGTITIIKNYLELTWATSCIVTTKNRYHSIINNGAAVKVTTDMDFSVITSATGPTPLEYTEYHEYQNNIN